MSNSNPNLRKIRAVILHSENQSTRDIITPQSDEAAVVRQAHDDGQVVGLWLHGRSPHTQKAYSTDIIRFFTFVNKQLRHTTLGDLQSFADSLSEENLKPASQHRILAAVKSLTTFAHKIGYLKYDISKPLRVPKFRDELSERILSESEVQRIIGMEDNPRNKLLLRILYAGGIRVSEICRLKWKDIQGRDVAGQMTVYGKGNKTHTIIIPEPLWSDLVSYQNGALDDCPVFKSRKGNHLNPSQVWRIVKKSSTRAGINKPVSPHWFRHAHASHALDRGAKISLVKETLAHSSINTTGRYLHAKPEESSSTYLQV